MSATNKSKKAVQEPESCMVCINNYTPIIRKKIVCKYCKADTCSKCIERYLLDRFEDAHCLHCRVNYNDATLNEICTKTYLKQTYFKHRQEILVNRERANLPGLQQSAIDEKKKRDNLIKIAELRKQIEPLDEQRSKIMEKYNQLYIEYYNKLTAKENTTPIREELNKYLEQTENLRKQINLINSQIIYLRWPNNERGGLENGEKPEEEEKKKFIRRCTRDGCQGFLSTAWKCAICEYYSCSKCFVPKTQKQDDPHECKKEDLETATMIKKDSKPCPSCGEFIMKSSGCSMMFCITCKTPWDWNTGKIVTSGHIHNPHYYEWIKRNGDAAPRNPADVPCGGYPGAWELRRMPKGMSQSTNNRFYEFHRICNEIQDISERTYRSHFDDTNTNKINVQFLLGDFDEKRWGQLLGINERKRKRDREIQEIFAAWRMVAVELINRIQNYSSKNVGSFTVLPAPEAEKFINEWQLEVNELIKMINDALRSVSISYNYTVPYIKVDDRNYYMVATKNFSSEVKKKRGAKKSNEETEGEGDADEEVLSVAESSDSSNTDEGSNAAGGAVKITKKKRPIIAPPSEAEILGEDEALQAAIEASLTT